MSSFVCACATADRACWTFAQYAEVKFASAATLTHGIHGVIRVCTAAICVSRRGGPPRSFCPKPLMAVVCGLRVYTPSRRCVPRIYVCVGLFFLVQCLKDPEIPVRFMAGSVLRFVLRNDACHEVRLLLSGCRCA